MPFKSEAQRRLFYAKAKRGEMSKATVKRWEDETPKKKLPERLGKEAALAALGLTKEAVVNELVRRVGASRPALPVRGRVLTPGQAVRPLAQELMGGQGPAKTYGGPAVTDPIESLLQNARRRYGTRAPKALAELEQQMAAVRDVRGQATKTTPPLEAIVSGPVQVNNNGTSQTLEMNAYYGPQKTISLRTPDIDVARHEAGHSIDRRPVGRGLPAEAFATRRALRAGGDRGQLATQYAGYLMGTGGMTPPSELGPALMADMMTMPTPAQQAFMMAPFKGGRVGAYAGKRIAANPSLSRMSNLVSPTPDIVNQRIQAMSELAKTDPAAREALHGWLQQLGARAEKDLRGPGVSTKGLTQDLIDYVNKQMG